VVEEEADIRRFLDGFQAVPALYIADGHHRSASAANVAKGRREKGGDPDAECNYMLSAAFPDTELRIMDYNRVAKDLNGLAPGDLLARVSERFAVSLSDSPAKPQKFHEFGMYLDKKWYRLKLKDTAGLFESLIDRLDASVLQNLILAPILGIGDPRTDKRIDFVGGIRGLRELERRVDSGEMAVAFSLCPTSMEQLMSIADAGETMPPKSTWFEPKLRSGLFVHCL